MKRYSVHVFRLNLEKNVELTAETKEEAEYEALAQMGNGRSAYAKIPNKNFIAKAVEMEEIHATKTSAPFTPEAR